MWAKRRIDLALKCVSRAYLPGSAEPRRGRSDLHDFYLGKH